MIKRSRGGVGGVEKGEGGEPPNKYTSLPVLSNPIYHSTDRLPSNNKSNQKPSIESNFGRTPKKSRSGNIWRKQRPREKVSTFFIVPKICLIKFWKTYKNMGTVENT